MRSLRSAPEPSPDLLRADNEGCPSVPSFVSAIRGRIGDRIYKTYGRKIVITRVPCFDGYVPTAAQRTRRALLRAATAYAQRIYADPAAKAFYIAAARPLRRQPFRLAISDYLRGHARCELFPPPKSPTLNSAQSAPHPADVSRPSKPPSASRRPHPS